MADRIEKDIQRFVQGVEQLISRRLPIYAGKTATQHFKDNFTKGGFVNGGLQPWTPSKRLSSGGQGADSKYGTWQIRHWICKGLCVEIKSSVI